jgi:hypothetical protein
MERKAIQTTLDEFNELGGHNQKESLRRIHENHVTKLSKIFNEVFERLFDQPYVVRCDE